jgi:hypothetical protein
MNTFEVMAMRAAHINKDIVSLLKDLVDMDCLSEARLIGNLSQSEIDLFKNNSRRELEEKFAVPRLVCRLSLGKILER